MTPPRPAPWDAELGRWVAHGLTYVQIPAAWERRTGEAASRGRLAGALVRAALMGPSWHRYYACIPWRLQPEHAGAPPAQMLRALGMRPTGFPVDPAGEARLDLWLALLERERAIVAYCPESDGGLLYVDESLRSTPHPEIPISGEAMRLNEVDGSRQLDEPDRTGKPHV